MIVKKKIEIIPVLLLATIVFSGCNKTAEPNTAKTVNISQTTAVANNNAASMTNAVSNSSVVSNNIAFNNTASGNAAANNSPNYPAAGVNNTTAATSVGRDDKKSSPIEKMPTPQIGSGGGDLSLFTQVRGALSSDQELMKAVTFEIKEGSATLNGNVSSEAQKTKAAQLVQSVNGVKSVKNNLRVSQ